MLKKLKQLWPGLGLARARREALNELMKTVSETHRPILRRSDLDKIERTHRELEDAVRETKDEASRLASSLSSALEQTKRRMSIIMDSLVDAIICVDYEGKILELNASVERLLGYEDGDLVGKNINETVLQKAGKSVDFASESVRYAKYLKTWIKDRDDFSNCKHLYRVYLETFTTGLNTPRVAECSSKAERASSMLEFYANILNIDCVVPEDLVYLVVLVDVSAKTSAMSEADELAVLQRSLLSTVQTPVFYKDEMLKFAGSNAAFSEFVGLKPSEFLGRSAFDVFPADVASQMTRIDLELLEDPTPHVRKHDIAIPNMQDNTYRDVVLYCSGMRSASGVFRGMLGTFVDMTDLLAAQKFSEILLDTIPQPVYLLDKDLKYCSCNNAYVELLGVPRAQLLGKSCEEVARFFNALESDREIAEYRQRDLDLKFGTERLQVYEKKVLNVQNQTHHHMMAHRKALYADNAFDGILCVLTDISYIEKSNLLHQKIVDTAPSPLYYKDADGRFVVCNDACASWLGIDKTEALGKKLTDLLPSDKMNVGRRFEAEEHYLIDKSLCNVNTFEITLKHPETKEDCKVKVYHSVLCGMDGRPEGFAGSFIELTKDEK